MTMGYSKENPWAESPEGRQQLEEINQFVLACERLYTAMFGVIPGDDPGGLRKVRKAPAGDWNVKGTQYWTCGPGHVLFGKSSAQDGWRLVDAQGLPLLSYAVDSREEAALRAAVLHWFGFTGVDETARARLIGNMGEYFHRGYNPERMSGARLIMQVLDQVCKLHNQEV